MLALADVFPFLRGDAQHVDDVFGIRGCRLSFSPLTGGC